MCKLTYSSVRNRPRKWIEDNTCPNAGTISFILNENPTQCRGLADFVNPLPGGGGGGGDILIHSLTLTRVTPPPPTLVQSISSHRLCALITLKRPQSTQWNSNDYLEYKKTRCTEQIKQAILDHTLRGNGSS